MITLPRFHSAFTKIRAQAAIYLAFLVFCAGLAAPAVAHFAQNLVVRSFMVAADEDGKTLTVYQDVPVPMLFAELLQDVSALPRDDPSAIIYADMSAGQGQIRISQAAVAANEAAFTKRLARNLIWRDAATGAELTPQVIAWRIAPTGLQTSWTEAAEAQALLAGPPSSGAAQGKDPEIARATVQFALQMPGGADTRLSLQLRGAALVTPAGVQIDNHVTDLRPEQPLIFATTGQLDAPMQISPGPLDRFAEFTWQGILHVFTGLDHVFLIICVALSPLALGPLIWRLTGFTIGHSVTLIATAMGWVLTGEMFIAWVEFLIAVTIIYAAVEALRQKAPSALALFGVGLVHGFGFASVLSAILTPGAPAFVISLLAFNVGIEIAQVVIVLAVLALLFGMRKIARPVAIWARLLTLLAAIALALLWALQKFPVGW